MRKVYEIKGRDFCRVKFSHCGVPVNVDFTGGTILNGKNAQYITDNQFVQDAIESDARFGSLIICTAKFEDKPAVTEETVSAPTRNLKQVKSVKNMNDAVDWFAVKGEGFSNKEELDDLCEKYGVCFPNLK